MAQTHTFHDNLWQLAIGARDTRRDDTLTGIPRGQPLPEVRPAAVAGAGD